MPVCFVRTPVALLIVTILTATGCQSNRGGTHDGDTLEMQARVGQAQQDVNALLDRYDEALRNKDVTALDQIWADDLNFVNPRGEVLTKQQRLDNINTGATAVKSSELSDRRVRVYGDTAVATMQVALQAQYSGEERSGKYRVTIVLNKAKGTWQMVVVHMSPIAA